MQAADQGIGGQAWDYRDMRSQQLLSRLIERMRALPQPIVCAVQVRSDGLVAGAAGWLTSRFAMDCGAATFATLPPIYPATLCFTATPFSLPFAGRGGGGGLCARHGQRCAHRQPRRQILGRICALGLDGCEQLLPLRVQWALVMPCEGAATCMLAFPPLLTCPCPRP